MTNNLVDLVNNNYIYMDDNNPCNQFIIACVTHTYQLIIAHYQKDEV